MQGDSSALEQVSLRARQNVSAPSSWLACNMAFGSKQLSAWLLDLSAAAQRIRALTDSVWCYDCKTDAAIRLRGVAGSRTFSDSVIALLSPERRKSIKEMSVYPAFMLILAFAQANVGNSKEATILTQSATSDFVLGPGRDSIPQEFSAHRVATVYARLDDTVRAMRWLKIGLNQSQTVRWYQMDPRLRPLHGTAVFERFVRENDH